MEEKGFYLHSVEHSWIMKHLHSSMVFLERSQISNITDNWEKKLGLLWKLESELDG